MSTFTEPLLDYEKLDRELHIILISEKVDTEHAFLWFVDHAYRPGHTLGLCYIDKISAKTQLKKKENNDEEEWIHHKLQNEEIIKVIECYENKCIERKIPYVVFRQQTSRNIGRILIEVAERELAKSITIISEYTVRHKFTGLSLSSYYVAHHSRIPVNVVPVRREPIVFEL